MSQKFFIHMKKENRQVVRFLFFCLSVMYLELVFHAAVFSAIDFNIVPPLLFGLACGVLFWAFTSVFPRIINIILGYILIGVLCMCYITQMIYYKIFGTFLSLVSVGGAENAMNFRVVLYTELRKNAGFIAALLLPLIVFVLLNIFVTDMGRVSLTLRRVICGAGACIFSFFVAAASLFLYGRGSYTPYDLFFNRYVLELSMEKLGVLVTTVKDAAGMRADIGEEKNFEMSGEAEETDALLFAEGSALSALCDDTGKRYVVYGPHIDKNLNLDLIYSESSDETVKNITAYISGVEPDMENNYTGIFSGYNVVFMTVESLSPYAVSEKYNPTLYRIMNEGFVYNNFYNPRWYHSTIDGEYVNCIGQYPCQSDWSFYKSADTYQPYALGNAMGALGYSCKAYHDFTFYYYNRSETHANMGYDFKAVDYGLELPYYTPYSDLDMMKAAVPDFIDEDKFVAYFMTFSGHLPYNYSYNAMSLKNKDEAESLTQGMNLSEESVSYIAAQMETDKALEYLIDELDKAGKLDNTVFIVCPDHYPYGLTENAYNELAGEGVYGDKFELHRSCLGIWSRSMEDGTLKLNDGTSVTNPIISDKLCASVDILPTVLNMLGVQYDSRLLAGHDIMSDSEGLVIFADHSFITDRVKYDTSSGEITYPEDGDRPDSDYIDEMTQRVENILYISDKIIDTDYFGIIYGTGE